MKIVLIAALAKGRVIGVEKRLPFRLASDLAFFKRTTLHGTLLMGRKTFESMRGPLAQRHHLVLSSGEKPVALHGEARVVWLSGFSEAVARAAASGVQELFVIGGARVFAEALPLAHEMLLTLVDAEVAGDTFFPEYFEGDFSREVLAKFPASVTDEYAAEIVRYRRKSTQ